MKAASIPAASAGAFGGAIRAERRRHGLTQLDLAVRQVPTRDRGRMDVDRHRHLRGFRESPETAQPIVLGPHRRAEAVLLPIEQYRALLERVEELSVRAEVADVLRTDDGRRGNVADLAREHGFDPAEFGLE